MSALLRLTGVMYIKSDFQKWIYALENPDESEKAQDRLEISHTDPAVQDR